ncbi:twin transmembrane helix small protein [Brevundimonas sp.]|uniref:twin transmembrane helix small protein n=1 Tax=Brevundimonas sp. TaxID=1871086 RepID=UPI0025C2EB08|nr:twin transmembrane helix small protein [Brevundimonas sp.]
MTVFDILILTAVVAVAVTLALGLRQLYKDGPEARSRSNKLMRLRVLLQAVAVVLLVAGMWWKSTHGA